MKVLVTGGAGYIGSHTAKALAAAGHEPVVLDNLSEGHRWAVKWGPLIEGDLADSELIRSTLRDHRIEAVIHFAAHGYVGESVSNPRKYFRNNVVNSMNLLDAMLDESVNRIVFSSTCATYGEPETERLTEDHAQKPVNPYGESKLFVEKMLAWYDNAYSLRSVSLRYFNAAGADADGELGEEHDPETHLIPLAIFAALGRAPALGIFGTDYPTADGTAIRDYIHVSDLADAHVRALTYLESGGTRAALNLATGRGCSVREVIDAVGRATGKPVPTIDAQRRAGDPPSLVADPTRALKVLGWKPAQSNLDTIVQTAAAWHARPPAR